MSNRYVFSHHISYPYGEGVLRTHCGMHTYDRENPPQSVYEVCNTVCKVCYFGRQSDWENIVMADVTLEGAEEQRRKAVSDAAKQEQQEMLDKTALTDEQKAKIAEVNAAIAKADEPDPANIRKYGVDGNFDTETYRILFNGFLTDPTELSISSEKAINDMDQEELTAHIYKLEDFVREAKVAKQAARITVEDRKLQMSEEQKKRQRELDNKYKPVVAAKASKSPAKKGTKAKLTEEEKRIKAAMDLLSLDEAGAISWLKSKGRL